MSTSHQTLIDLENRFWQSIVDEDSAAAVEMLAEPAVMVNAHGAMKFDHAGYRRMAQNGPVVLTSFELSDVQVVFPNDSTAVVTYHVRQEVAPRGQDKRNIQEMHDSSTWVRTDGKWRCVLHTESTAESGRKTQ